MAPSKPMVAFFFKLSLADPLDESSMLQMPIVEKTVQADASECRCPGFFEEDCINNAFQGCIWTDAGDSNAPWCQCDPNFVPEPPLYTNPSPPAPPPLVHEHAHAFMGAYPGYTGDLHFTGSVSVDESGGNLMLSWSLSGLEPELCATAPAGVANACGIHIHSGTTCDEASGVGGHYYHDSLDSDPWSPVVYTPDSTGSSVTSDYSIATGQSLSDVLGRAVVVHDHTGGRVACGIIHSPHSATATMDAYPGYAGDLQFTGSVSVDESGDSLLLSWHLSGLEAELCATAPAGVANACGIHIHSGTTCGDASSVGGHYYHDSLAADPWSPVVYTPDASGVSTSTGNSIAIGQSFDDIVGRAMVVHDHTGARVACGIITE